MTRLPHRFVEDRALRDKARALLTDDIARLRGALEEEGIASRVSSGMTSTIADRLKTGAHDVLEQARVQAEDRKGILAVLLGAIVLWFARGPILDWFHLREEDEPRADDDTEIDTDHPAAPSSRAARDGDQ